MNKIKKLTYNNVPTSVNCGLLFQLNKQLKKARKIEKKYEGIKKKYDMLKEGRYIQFQITANGAIKIPVAVCQEKKCKPIVSWNSKLPLDLCGVCIAEIESHWVFCPYCGFEIDWENGKIQAT